MQAFQAIYKRMEVKVVERGESFYNPYLKALVEDLMERGVAEVSEGATVVFVKVSSLRYAIAACVHLLYAIAACVHRL